MTAAARTYGVMISVAMANMLQYRAVMLLWAAWGIIAPMVSLAVWTAAAQGRSLAGFDRGALAGYFAITMVVSHLTTAWDTEILSWFVRSGQLSSRLLRPMHPVFQSVADNLAYKITTIGILLPIWLGIGWIVRPELHLTPARFLWFLLSLLLASSLTFIWGYCVAMIAFWTTNVRAVNQFYYTAMTFLAGRMAPLALLPTALQTLSWCLPFRWMIAFPVEVALGTVPMAQIPIGIAWQAFWVVAGVGTFHLIWGRGVRAYSAVGG